MLLYLYNILQGYKSINESIPIILNGIINTFIWTYVYNKDEN